jgi:hypothetical protein
MLALARATASARLPHSTTIDREDQSCSFNWRRCSTPRVRRRLRFAMLPSSPTDETDGRNDVENQTANGVVDTSTTHDTTSETSEEATQRLASQTPKDTPAQHDEARAISSLSFAANDGGSIAVPTENKLVESAADPEHTGSDADGNSRDEWGSHAESILSMIGFAVGIGNIWRFPHVAYKYGGGSFLVPYALAMLFLGIPLMTLEMVLGQTLRGGLIRSLSLIHPRLRGAGISAMMSNAFVMVYYAVLLAWSLLYMGHSLNDPLPWAQTPAQWNSTGVCQCWF